MRKRMEGFISGLMVAALFLFIWLFLGTLVIRAQAKEDLAPAYLEEICEMYNMSPELVQAIIERESRWDPNAVNGPCVGLMQIDPDWHAERMQQLGVRDLTDPEENILVGVDYLHELFLEYEDVYAVLMFYNAGYSAQYGLRAYEDGRYSDYAKEVAARAMVLEMLHGK